ncbi:hypothetical protein AS594_35635 [Streptomyces agglomeratus]|uniref:Helicase-associated domain-containing protein n=1 Tax=Streptomyces agglomeratus TaxID=285458 RepID=A0A1E5PHN1_9ACTN|nr:hypothetical protein AS594_35635 [Streptomyces agglomeratus]
MRLTKFVQRVELLMLVPVRPAKIEAGRSAARAKRAVLRAASPLRPCRLILRETYSHRSGGLSQGQREQLAGLGLDWAA